MSRAATSPGAQLWVKRYDGAPDEEASATSVAASPNGKAVFVTGHTNINGLEDYTTIAYNGVTGAQMWIKNLANSVSASGPPIGGNWVAVSPNGKTVFVTGAARNGCCSAEYATIAYNAATGAQLWLKRYNPSASTPSVATEVVVSPNGQEVYVTGHSAGVYATVAYNAATGAQRWAKRFAGYGSHASVAVSPNGKEVLVSEGSTSATTNKGSYVTAAYNAATGAQLWLKRYSGSKTYGDGDAHAMTVSPNGLTVFVTGVFYKEDGSAAYATIAYKVANGGQRWVKWYDSPTGDSTADGANSVAASPNGKTVFVTGDIDIHTVNGGTQDATIAYNAATGAQLWVKIYYGSPPNGDDTVAAMVAASPNGKDVYVTGSAASTTYATTIAYNAATGAPLWVRRYNPGDNDLTDGASAMAVSSGTGTVFVTGSGNNLEANYYLTIAYAG
jgi:PQQ-like domain